MEYLDDLNIIKEYDPNNALSSIDQLDKQCKYALEKAENFEIPGDYFKYKKVIFAGMGGSSYSGRLIKSVYKDEIKVPVEFINDYTLPGYADSETLVVIATYSGSTEESLSCAEDSIKRKCKVLGICKGGKLAEFLGLNIKPVFTFSSEFNPSLQPRLGQGYMIFSHIVILARLGLFSYDKVDLQKAIDNLTLKKQELAFSKSVSFNRAKSMAISLQNEIISIIAGNILEGGVHTFRNTLHETGKQYANYYLIPEANHHLMEGLSNPEFVKKNHTFLLIKSAFYPKNIQKRMEITKTVIEENGLKVKEINLSPISVLSQNMELIQFASYTAFYLAMLHKINPSLIPWVDYFKNELSKNENKL